MYDINVSNATSAAAILIATITTDTATSYGDKAGSLSLLLRVLSFSCDGKDIEHIIVFCIII